MSETTTTETTEDMQARVEAKLAKSTAKNPANPVLSKEDALALITSAMDKAEAEGRDRADAIKGVPPIAFTARIKPGVKLGDTQSFLSRTVELQPVVNPLFHALLCQLGAKPDGARSYRISATASTDPKFLIAIMDVLPGGICYSDQEVEIAEKNGFHSHNTNRHTVYGNLFWGFRELEAGEHMPGSVTVHMRNEHPLEGPLAGAAIVMTASKKTNMLHLKVCTTRISDGDREGLFFTDDPGAPDLNRFKPNNTLDPQSVTPDQAITMLEEAAAQGYQIVDPSGDLKTIRSLLADMVVAQRVPGQPGAARLVVGAKIDTSTMKGVDARLPDNDETRSTRHALTPALIAGAAINDAEKGGAVATILDPEVQDVINMAAAIDAPAPSIDTGIDGVTARPYQEECVALHMATRVGVLNACSPGLGKTLTTLWGMRGWADRAREARDTGVAPSAAPSATDSAPDPLAEMIAVTKAAAAKSSNPATIETLTCSDCGQDWQREAKRGRKPVKCPDC